MSTDSKESKLHTPPMPSLQELSARPIVEAIVAGNFDPDDLNYTKKLVLKDILKYVLSKNDLLMARRQRFAPGRHFDPWKETPVPQGAELLCAMDNMDAITGMYAFNHELEGLVSSVDPCPSHPVLHYLVLKDESQDFSIDKFKKVVGGLIEGLPGILDLVDADGNTALHIAIKNGQMERVKVLIDAGADEELTNLAGRTPLDMAATPEIRSEIMQLLEKRSQEDILKAFIDAIKQRDILKSVAALLAGTDPDHEFDHDECYGPVLVHAQKGLSSKEAEFFRILLDILPKFGAEKSRKTAYEMGSLRERSELISAAKVKRLGEYKENARTNVNGENASEEERRFIYAIQHQNIQEAIEALLAGVDPNICFDYRGNYGSALVWACDSKDKSGIFFEKLLDVMLDFGANINVCDSQGNSILSKAVEYENIAAARLLLARGADPTLKDKEGKSAVERCENELSHLRNPGLQELYEIDPDYKGHWRESAVAELHQLLSQPTAIISSGLSATPKDEKHSSVFRAESPSPSSASSSSSVSSQPLQVESSIQLNPSSSSSLSSASSSSSSVVVETPSSSSGINNSDHKRYLSAHSRGLWGERRLQPPSSDSDSEEPVSACLIS